MGTFELVKQIRTREDVGVRGEGCGWVRKCGSAAMGIKLCEHPRCTS
jgi:hypothetical protein